MTEPEKKKCAEGKADLPIPLCCMINPDGNTGFTNRWYLQCVYCRGNICEFCIDTFHVEINGTRYYHHEKCKFLCDHKEEEARTVYD